MAELAVSMGYMTVQQVPGSGKRVDVMLWGSALGLRASRLHSGAKKAEGGDGRFGGTA